MAGVVVVDHYRRPALPLQRRRSTRVVTVRVGQDDPLNIAGCLAEFGQPGDDPSGRPLQAAVDEGEAAAVGLGEDEGVDEVEPCGGDPPDVLRQSERMVAHPANRTPIARRAALGPAGSPRPGKPPSLGG